MQTDEFLINLFSGFSVFDIQRIKIESLELFLKDYEGGNYFKKNFGNVDVKGILEGLPLLSSLNLISLKGIFKKNIIVNQIPKDVAIKLLSTSTEEEVVTLLSLSLKYKQFSSKVDGLSHLSEDQINMNTSNKEIESTMKDTIRLINNNRS